MTNPVAIITLYAANAFHKNIIAQQNIPKSLLYVFGTTIFATVLYKSINKYTNKEHQTPLYHFFYTFSQPFKYIYDKFQQSKKDKIELFENKYFKEYDEWKTNKTNNNPTTLESNVIINNVEEAHEKERLENMYYVTVTERINDFYGDVIMCYDAATLSFAYYARTANIPYKYLETISRKYMIETDAPREIHVDIRNEYKKAKEKTSTAPTPTPVSAPPSSKDDTPFVKLKAYNTASNLNLHTTTNDTKEKTHKFVTHDDATKQENSSTIIRENANRYSYRGKLSDFASHHNTFLADRRKTASACAKSDTENNTTTQNSSYAEFKKQMLQQRSAL